METKEDLDKKIEELEKKKGELKEAKEKKKRIDELNKEIKQYSKSKEIEELNKIVSGARKYWIKFIDEASKGIKKIQEHNRKQLEKEKTKNLNNRDDKNWIW